MKKCYWDFKSSEELIRIDYEGEEILVNPSNRQAAESFLADLKTNKLVFIVSQVLIVGAILFNRETAFIMEMLKLTAIVLLVMPYSTPQTVQLMGIQNSIRLVRLVAIVLFVFASWYRG